MINVKKPQNAKHLELKKSRKRRKNIRNAKKPQNAKELKTQNLRKPSKCEKISFFTAF